MVNDHGKLLVLLVAMAGGFAMVLLGALVPVAGAGLITPGVGLVASVLGYVTGNGVLAVKGQRPSPAFARPGTLGGASAYAAGASDAADADDTGTFAHGAAGAAQAES